MMICSGSQSMDRVSARCCASASRSAGRPPPYEYVSRSGAGLRHSALKMRPNFLWELSQVGHPRHERAPLVRRCRHAIHDGRAARRQRRTRRRLLRLPRAAAAGQIRIRHRGIDEGAVALPAAGIAFGQQLAVDVNDGVAGNAQFGRQVPGGGQARVRGNGSIQDGFTDAAIEPLVHGLAGAVGQAQQQQVTDDGPQLVLPDLSKWFPQVGPS